MNASLPLRLDARTSAEPEISTEAFARFQAFFHRATGIFFEESKRYFVDRRLVERILATRSADFAAYFHLLRNEPDGAELQRLVNVMTVNETYFFREDHQFHTLISGILPELVARKPAGEPIRIWCIPSSTGEELYSLAIHLLEFWPDADRHEIEIVGSDIDTDVLAMARAGRYGQRSLARVPQVLLAKYFRRETPDSWRIIPELRGSIEFTRVNLVDPLQTRGYRDFDVVFCRNLLIYFDDASRRAAADAIYGALRPGGFICLGHSESMSRISAQFRARRFGDVIVHQKPASGTAGQDSKG